MKPPKPVRKVESKAAVPKTLTLPVKCNMEDVRIIARDPKTGVTYLVDDISFLANGHAKLRTMQPVEFCLSCGKKPCMSPVVHTSDYEFSIQVQGLVFALILKPAIPEPSPETPK